MTSSYCVTIRKPFKSILKQSAHSKSRQKSVHWPDTFFMTFYFTVEQACKQHVQEDIAAQEAYKAEIKARVKARLRAELDYQETKEKARLQAEEAARLEAFACRRCPAKFASNTKLHEHVRDHHTKTASPTSPASPKLSLSAITSIQIAPASPTLKAAPSPKAAPPPKAASTQIPVPPLTPPTTPPKTWAAVASKPASATSPLTSPPTPAQTSPQPPKSYLTIADLYRMFHLKKQPHQTRINTFFKPLRNSQRNTPSTTKTQTLSPTSPASLSRKTATYQLRKSTGWSFQRFVSGLPLKTAPGKRFENTIHTAPPTFGTAVSKCPGYYGRHIKCSAGRRRHLKDL